MKETTESHILLKNAWNILEKRGLFLGHKASLDECRQFSCINQVSGTKVEISYEKKTRTFTEV